MKQNRVIAQVTFTQDTKRLYEFYINKNLNLQFNARYYITADDGYEYNKSIQIVNFVQDKEYAGEIKTIMEAIKKE